jgi:hypothetical protein
MVRTRLTWVVVSGIAGLLAIAVADALRSGGQTSLLTESAATTTRQGATTPLFSPNCARRQIALSIEIREGVATVVVRHVRGERCFQPFADFRFLITNRAKHRIGLWMPPMFAERYEGGDERTFALPDVFRCDRPGPFIAKATLGPYSARRGNLTRSQITC